MLTWVTVELKEAVFPSDAYLGPNRRRTEFRLWSTHAYSLRGSSGRRFCELMVKSVCRPQKACGGWRYSSSHYYLGLRWRWVVSFTLRPPYFRGKTPWEPIRVGGPRTGLDNMEYDHLLPGIEPRFFCCPTRRLGTVPTTVSRLPGLRKCMQTLRNYDSWILLWVLECWGGLFWFECNICFGCEIWGFDDWCLKVLLGCNTRAVWLVG